MKERNTITFTRVSGERIRRTGRVDVAALLHLERACFARFHRAHQFNAEDFTRHLQSASCVWTFARKGGRLAGYALGVVKRRGGRVGGEIPSIAVHPSFRRRGVGRTLLARLVALLRRKGCGAVIAEAAERNSGALALFRQVQFRPVRRLRHYYGTGYHALRLRRTLN